MGLDNGIFLRKVNDFENYDSESVDIIEEQYSLHSPNQIFRYQTDNHDLCYWRKCWGFRNSVMMYLKNKYSKETNEDECEYVLDIDDLQEITNLIFSILQNPDNWEQSLFSWEEYINNNCFNLMNILHLIEDIKNGYINTNEVQVVWYDSY